MLPSSTAKKTSLLRHEKMLAHDQPGKLTIGGREYAGRVELGPKTFLPLADGGAARGQRLAARILKSALPTPPAEKTVVTHNGVEFKVSEIGGENSTEVAWLIRALRWLD